MESKILKASWGVFSYIEKDGTSPILVFVHGAGNAKEVWKGLIEELPYHSMALDLPGHGGSSYKPLEFMEDYASSVEEFIKALGLKKPVLVGHSMGGAIAIKLSASIELGAAILVGTGGRLWVNPKLLTKIRENFHEAVDLVSKWSFFEGVSEDLKKAFSEMVLRTGRFVFYQDMRACNEYAGERELKNMRCPALIVCGRDDLMTPVDLSEKMKSKIPNAHLVVLENCGHMVHMEKPKELAKKIKKFLRGA